MSVMRAVPALFAAIGGAVAVVALHSVVADVLGFVALVSGLAASVAVALRLAATPDSSP